MDVEPVFEPVSSSPLAIEASGLVKVFGEVRAVDGIDLTVPAGAVYGVLGPNGAGKTTAIRALATLLRPDGGEARVLGHDIVREADAVRSRVSLTGQFARSTRSSPVRRISCCWPVCWASPGRTPGNGRLICSTPSDWPRRGSAWSRPTPAVCAVALLADGRTATMLVEAAGVTDGDRVLVEAAAGGLGSLLVQLAGARGSTVVAAAGGARKVEAARALGAGVVVDYREAGWTERVRDAVGGLDVVFDGVGGTIGRSAFELLDRGGRMLIFGRASGEWTEIPDEVAADRGVTKVPVPRPTPEETRALTERALAEAAAGRLRPVIGQRYALDRAADAHAAMESRATVGKTLLEVR